MVKRIVWTSKAEHLFTKILKYYAERNGSKKYSKKVNSDIKNLISLLKKHPFLGQKTELKNIRVLIKGNYKIYYQLKPKEITIHLVWETRQDGEKIDIF